MRNIIGSSSLVRSRNENESELSKPKPTKTIQFTVDSALLRELGERLVGKPHIALAELVKNSYDADARKVELRLFRDRIEVSDNGHGMTFDEFRDFWMRIGTPHKQEQRLSRHASRPLTGSKGVGRLAVQFLSRELEIRTVAENPTEEGIMALVDWDQSVLVGDLTEAQALYDYIPRRESFPDNSEHGTTIVLGKLNQEWSFRRRHRARSGDLVASTAVPDQSSPQLRFGEGFRC